MKSGTLSSIRFAGALFLTFLAVCGCATRSISDSGYRKEDARGSAVSSNPFYKGELSEFQVLGINPETAVRPEAIERAVGSVQHLSVPRGSSILLIQSGALIPDAAMVKALERV